MRNWIVATALALVACTPAGRPASDIILSANFELGRAGQKPAPNLPDAPSGDSVKVEESPGLIRLSNDRPLAGAGSLRFREVRPGGQPGASRVNKATFFPLPRREGSSIRITWLGRSNGLEIVFRLIDRETGREFYSGSISPRQVAGLTTAESATVGTDLHSVTLEVDTSLGLARLEAKFGDRRVEIQEELRQIPGTARDLVLVFEDFGRDPNEIYDLDNLVIRRLR